VQQFEQAAATGGDQSETAMRSTMTPIVKNAYTLPVVQGDAIYFARDGLKGVQLYPQGSRVNPLDWSH